jgi:apolipoprotein N-acyltransferase
VPGLPPVAGSVCYEAIFPGETMPPGPRPGLILNVTNDGWFGDTPGPRQHFAQARLRAVERGIPLVRAANTGISAVVDPYGRITDSLAVGQESVIDADLPAVANATVFDNVGMPIVLGLCSAFFLAALAGMRRRPR